MKYLYSRPNITTGFGPVIDDLERMADKPDHGMTARSDPGNWAHELTHYVNSMFRQAASKEHGRPWNGFYCLDGYAVTLPEPKVTLEQVSSMVPRSQHNAVYKNYFVSSRQWWDNEPLYLLDEATAAMNGLQYFIYANEQDCGRADLLEKWRVLTPYLIKAVENFDPGYDHLDELKAFVAWQRAYSHYLLTQHKRLDN